MNDILTTIWLGTVTIQSNLARTEAQYIAVLALEGYITTIVPEGYGTVWRLTPDGLLRIWPLLLGTDE